MNIQELADILGLQIIVTYYPNQNGRWSARFEGVETKKTANSGLLESTYGNGKNSRDAIMDYAKLIRGKLLVVNAGGGTARREHVVPLGLVGGL